MDHLPRRRLSNQGEEELLRRPTRTIEEDEGYVAEEEPQTPTANRNGDRKKQHRRKRKRKKKRHRKRKKNEEALYG